MLDPRVTKLAELLCTHSCQLSGADSVLVHTFDIPEEVVAEVVRVAQSKGAKVAVRMESNLVRRQLLHGSSVDAVQLIAEVEKYEMERMTAYIALRGSENSTEHADVPGENMQIWTREYTIPVVFGVRVPKTKWVALRWPTPSFAQMAGMSTPAFEKFYFDVCTMDYAKMARAAQPLADLMSRTDRVRVIAPGTDFSMSIKDIGAVPCTGHRNIPDGECFTAPVRDSVNGVVQFNTVSLYQGTEFKDIRYVIKNGRIEEATAGANTEKLNQILDTDEGARYFGEFAIGFNPHVLHPMKDTLFDEKIAGSLHFTPGNAYDPPGGNGNKSAVHWDTVLIQRPDYGGGEIYFDDVLIRKDGLFVLPELLDLNPDRLS
ncbi:aminopeptidase [Fimbriimonas ginsengisoli]|uniref:Peptidase M29 aminopeptidase II n=1 Tax=Fimbriimonas ginsengisoli Gsoil 348 TaxID=661478 RepID=A0A068NN64_FIMGI|nr:aminopeptidase [Fimbriimonas ginsengisoli]AIE84842.1 peptidase M29 aminopeptidase II [Fimbriimonas ginsengisoli Gsoil 348]